MFAEKLGREHHSLLTREQHKKEKRRRSHGDASGTLVRHDLLSVFDRLSKGPLGVGGWESGKCRDECFSGARGHITLAKLKMFEFKTFHITKNNVILLKRLR